MDATKRNGIWETVMRGQGMEAELEAVQMIALEGTRVDVVTTETRFGAQGLVSGRD